MSDAIRLYKDIALFQPVVNGLNCNLVAIFSSRLCTALHRDSVLGRQAEWAPKRWYMYPYEAYFGKLSLKII